MVLTVPVAGTELTVSAFGKPITDQVNANTVALTAGAWTPVTFQGTWANQTGGSQPVQYRKLGDMVQLRGQMAAGSMSSPAFTLPVGFRPPFLFMLSTGCFNGSAWVVARMDMNTDGRCVPIDGVANFYSVLCSFSISA